MEYARPLPFCAPDLLQETRRAGVSESGRIASLVARVLQSDVMSRRITQRELRNSSGEIMRALDRGETFIVTRNSVPVGELRPLPRQFVSATAVAAAFACAPPIDRERFRGDLDAFVDQDPTPRG